MRSFIVIGFLLTLMACSNSELGEMRQLSNGAKLYKTHCANCHQENGTGLAQLIPPLAESDLLKAQLKNLPCWIRNGMAEPIQVNGTRYTQAMPANKGLSRQELEDISVFVALKFVDSNLNPSDSVFSEALNKCQ